jgi:hypothetical protein
MFSYKHIIILCLAAMPLITVAQDVDSRSPKPDHNSTKLQGKAEKKKEKRKINAEKAEKKNLKHAMKIQSREVRKRMKKSQKKANSWNANHTKGGFLHRWFGKKNN